MKVTTLNGAEIDVDRAETQKDSVIVGAGIRGVILLACLKEAGVNVVGFLDDKEDLQGKKVHGVPVLGNTDMLKSLFPKPHYDYAIYCAIGDNTCRKQFLFRAQNYGYDTPHFVHSSVTFIHTAKLGSGVYIFPLSIITHHAEIGDFSLIEQDVHVDPYAKLGVGVYLGSGVKFGEEVVAEDFVHVGMNTVIKPGMKTLGRHCYIRMNSVVYRDVPPGVTVMGDPAEIVG